MPILQRVPPESESLIWCHYLIFLARTTKPLREGVYGELCGQAPDHRLSGGVSSLPNALSVADALHF